MESVGRAIQSMMSDIEQVDRSLAFEELPQRVILLVGETKAGKTTLMYYLLGKKLERWYNKDIGVYMMRPQSQFFNAYIGNNYDSTTVYPNIPTQLGQDNVLVIDLPGFSDTRCQYKLFNIYIVREVIKKIRNVHVSLVVSNQTKDANGLMEILERYIALLNPGLLLTQNSLSFMLTKVDGMDDLEVLEESLKAIAEEKDESGDVMRILAASNKYFFLNDEPKVEEGVRLRNRMVNENKFFEINRETDNLLSKQYANVIAGEDGEDFEKFTIELINGVEESIASLFEIYMLCMVEHHERDFSLLQIYLSGEKLARKEEIKDLAVKLQLSRLGEMQIFEDGPEEALSTSVLNLLKKFQKFPAQDGQNYLFNGELDNLQEWTRLFKSQVSKISSIFRETIYRLLRACIKILKTVSQINFSSIRQRYDEIRQSSKITAVIQRYNAFYVDNELLNRIAHNENGKKLRGESEELRAMLLAKLPNLEEEEEGDCQVETVKIPVRHEIKNKKVLKALQETSKGEPRPKRIDKAANININIKTLDEETVKITNSMPIEASSLRILLEAIDNHRLKLNSLTDSMAIRAGKKMFTKVAQILDTLCHTQQAILFLLAVGCEFSASLYIRHGLNYRLISTPYITSILIPYYSTISPNFSIIQLLFNHLTLLTYNMKNIIQNQKIYLNILQKMHTMNFEELPVVKMFQMKYVEVLLREREGLYEGVKEKEESLKNGRISTLQKEIDEISNI